MTSTKSPADRRLAAALRRGATAKGVWCSIASAYGAEILADAGPDFLVIDCQHGLIGFEATVAMLQAVSRTEVTPLVRVAANDASLIGRALDAGADGVIVPMVHDAPAAGAAVAACRYPPSGARSYGPARSAMVTRGSRAEVNAAVLCVPLIESLQGARAAAEICAVPGVDAVMIGMADLAFDARLDLGDRSAELDTAVASITAAARGADLPIMIGVGDAHLITDPRGLMVVVASDTALLRSGLQRSLSTENGTPPR